MRRMGLRSLPMSCPRKVGRLMWHYFHTYRRLANEGRVKYLTCPDCDTRLDTRLRPNDDTDSLWLWCATCDAWTKPGLDLFDQVKAVVHEHLL